MPEDNATNSGARMLKLECSKLFFDEKGDRIIIENANTKEALQIQITDDGFKLARTRGRDS